MMKPHLKETMLLTSKILKLVGQGRAVPIRPEGAALLGNSYRRNAALMLDPWIKVWQLVHGANSSDPAPIP
jgi:hypothetical protein